MSAPLENAPLQASMQEWPFDIWLKTAVRGFGLSPTEFWQMSVRDWLALLAGHQELGLVRTDLDTLMNTYPDKTSPDKTGQNKETP